MNADPALSYLFSMRMTVWTAGWEGADTVVSSILITWTHAPAASKSAADLATSRLSPRPPLTPAATKDVTSSLAHRPSPAHLFTTPTMKRDVGLATNGDQHNDGQILLPRSSRVAAP
jgi:hypothetical protein